MQQRAGLLSPSTKVLYKYIYIYWNAPSNGQGSRAVHSLERHVTATEWEQFAQCRPTPGGPPATLRSIRHYLAWDHAKVKDASIKTARDLKLGHSDKAKASDDNDVTTWTEWNVLREATIFWLCVTTSTAKRRPNSKQRPRFSIREHIRSLVCYSTLTPTKGTVKRLCCLAVAVVLPA